MSRAVGFFRRERAFWWVGVVVVVVVVVVGGSSFFCFLFLFFVGLKKSLIVDLLVCVVGDVFPGDAFFTGAFSISLTASSTFPFRFLRADIEASLEKPMFIIVIKLLSSLLSSFIFSFSVSSGGVPTLIISISFSSCFSSISVSVLVLTFPPPPNIFLTNSLPTSFLSQNLQKSFSILLLSLSLPKTVGSTLTGLSSLKKSQSSA
mmetsp:Transcript_24997/g.47003  ORF Transcript_24997/g.47003 Transcript_24997/m.47003 type:complete len:205 (-) Transcript_24997:75-689(-)